ncbi:MAG: hypothetical protein RJA63_564 [Pseudomonadota bacterium]
MAANQSKYEFPPTIASQIQCAAEAAGLSEYLLVFALDPSLTSPETIQARIKLAEEVRDLSVLSGHADLADELIRSGASRQSACDRITAARADASDALYIDGAISSEHFESTTERRRAGVSSSLGDMTQDIWSARTKAGHG